MQPILSRLTNLVRKCLSEQCIPFFLGGGLPIRIEIWSRVEDERINAAESHNGRLNDCATIVHVLEDGYCFSSAHVDFVGQAS